MSPCCETCEINGWFTAIYSPRFGCVGCLKRQFFWSFDDGWLTSGENRGIGEHFVEMEGNLIEFGDHMGQPSHSMDVENVQSTEVSQPVNLTLKNKRSTVKRKITIHLKSLAALIEQCGSKTRINRIMADLRSCLQQAEELNVQYLSFVPEIEHDKVLEWYDFEFARVNEALDEAVVHLEERASEEASVVSSNVSRNSKASHKGGKDPISAKAKAAAAQAYVRKQKEIAKEKLREIESQAELQRKLLKSKEEAERVRLEAELELEKQRSISEEAQKTRELELEVIRLEVEAKALEKEAHDPDNLQERLEDFEDEETIPASHDQENDKAIKPDEVPENPMTSGCCLHVNFNS